MPKRNPLLFFGLGLAYLMLASCANAPSTKRITLSSQRTPMSVTADSPPGWTGPGYASWPSYDSWGFSIGEDPNATYISVRFDPVSNDETFFGSATPAQIVAYFKDTYSNPQAEVIASINLDGSSVSVYAIHNVGGEEYATDVRHGSTKIGIELTAPDRQTLDRYRMTFLTFLNSLQITSTRPTSN